LGNRYREPPWEVVSGKQLCGAALEQINLFCSLDLISLKLEDSRIPPPGDKHGGFQNEKKSL